MLTSYQKTHFDTFGFLRIKKMFSPEETAIITRELVASMDEARGGKPFNGKERQTVVDWFKGRDQVDFLANDDRIHKPIKQLLGPGYIMQEGNDGNYYVGNTGWHPDMGWSPNIPGGENDPEKIAGRRGKNHYVPSIKVAFYLDTVQKNTGCLRVIPGSHRNPLHDKLWSLHMDIPANAKALEDVPDKILDMWERDTGSREGGERLLSDMDFNHFRLDPEHIPSYPVESEPGDAVFFSHQMWHSSFGGKVGRRMFTLNFRSN